MISLENKELCGVLVTTKLPSTPPHSIQSTPSLQNPDLFKDVCKKKELAHSSPDNKSLAHYPGIYKDLGNRRSDLDNTLRENEDSHSCTHHPSHMSRYISDFCQLNLTSVPLIFASHFFQRTLLPQS